MAIQLRASSSFSSAPSTRSQRHDVFLSFRGEDTRYGFTGHLYNSLVRRGIKTFIDNDLRRGEEISQALLRAIEESKLSLIVFSENYASSKWCLEELVYILECKRLKNQMVLPIYYKVDPSDVRHQRGKFGESHADLERRFNDDMRKVLRWRAALSEAATLSGWHFSGGYDEFILIDRIVEEILKIFPLEPTYLGMPKCQVGLDSRVERMLNMLDVGGSDVRMVGIWGTSGIGKTTIAKAVYNAIAQKFDGCCFLENVRECSEQHRGLANLQRIILSNIVRLKELEINNVHEGITLLPEMLRHKRILLVLDDVNKSNQLDTLAGASDWFGHGSRIIITTRDKRLLTVHDINLIYKARELDHHEGCKLFSSYAFKSKSNSLDNNEKLLVSTVVEYARGLPLVLRVLGSHLYERPLHKWQAMIEGCKRNHLKDVKDILKVSYDGLEKTEREVFLDIACFFNGRDTNDVIQILEGCSRINPEHSIEILEEKALINAPECGQISMHNLLEEMGKQIVDQESNMPGQRSRLWYHADVLQVLTEYTGTSTIEGIIVNMPTTDEIRLSPKCFKNMKNLKIFVNVNGRFVGKVEHYPNQLRLLDWPECPLEYLPSGFDTKKMVQLNMPGSRIIRLGEHDLTPRIAPNLDRHLVFPLMEFLQERQLYPDELILKCKIDLLNRTNMVDYAMDIHKSLYHTDDVPQEMVEMRAGVVARLKALEESAAPLVNFLQNASAVQELRADKQYNLQMLNDRYQIGPDQIEALYQYAKFQFECGNYSGAADYLYQYRLLCTNSERSLSALWGKLAAEILMQNWDIALEELNRLKEIIDSKNFSSPMNQVQSRIWLMHWSLFIFFNNDNGRTQIIDLFNQDKYLNAIQTNAPHLIRYLATAFIVNKRRRPQFKDFIKVIQQEQHSYKDPITEFLTCVYVNYDFDGAQKKMWECQEVILNDPFLGKRVEEGNFTTVPFRDEFLENARLFIFETYCRIHQRIDMGVLAEKLNLNYEEAERWIVNLIRSSKLDAKIDSQSGTVIMEPNHPNVYEQLIDHTKALSGRTYKLVGQIREHAQTQAAR